MAAPMMSKEQGARRTSLISRTLERWKSGLKNRIGIGVGGAGERRPPAVVVAGCFPVYVGPERARFVVRAEHASHPLFRRLLDDAEREFGHAAARGGPLALPSCDVDAFLDVLWHMEHAGAGAGGDDDDDDEFPAAGAGVSSSPICGLVRSCSSRGGRAATAGYRMMHPRSRSFSSPATAVVVAAARRWSVGELSETKHARTRSYS